MNNNHLYLRSLVPFIFVLGGKNAYLLTLYLISGLPDIVKGIFILLTDGE
jgi:hypothetical protein